LDFLLKFVKEYLTTLLEITQTFQRLHLINLETFRRLIHVMDRDCSETDLNITNQHHRI
jgi:hypothetical protein